MFLGQTDLTAALPQAASIGLVLALLTLIVAVALLIWRALSQIPSEAAADLVRATLQEVGVPLLLSVEQKLSDLEETVRQTPAPYDDVALDLARRPTEALLAELRRRGALPNND